MQKPVKFNKKQQLAFTTSAHEILYGGARAGGKGQGNDAIVITPFGPQKFGDLKVGSKLNNPDGSVCEVIQVHPEEEFKFYKIKFSDGTETEVTEGHLWLSWRSNKTKKIKKIKTYGKDSAKIITTNVLKEWCDTAKKQKKRGLKYQNWPLIPICQEQPFNVTYRYKSDIDPYLLGLMIGDGHFGKNYSLACSIDRSYIKTQIVGMNYREYDKAIIFSGDSLRILKESAIRLKLHETRAATKFIPRQFKLGSVKERYAIIQGLMDTDGSVEIRDKESDTAKVTYSTISKQLAYDIKFIIQSLGGCVTISEKIPTYTYKNEKKLGNLAYILYIKFPNPQRLFRLPRKKSQAYKATPQSMFRKVVSVESIGRKLGHCITVSHPNGLYLTNDFIVTHNSFLIRYASILYSIGISGLQTYLFRRNVKDLKKNHLSGHESFQSILNPLVKKERCKINQTDLRIDFDNGSQIHLCHCQHDKDVEKYRGAEIHFLLIDESTQFTPFQIDFLRTNVRVGGFHIDYEAAQKTLPFIYEGFFPRIMYATNPGGISHNFFKSGWMKPQYPPMTIFTAPKDEGGMDRIYIPAQITDNEDLMKNDPTYRDKLMGLGEDNEVRAMLYGDWDALGGDAFGDVWNPKCHIVEPFPIPKRWYIDRTFDWGSSHPFSVMWWAESDGETFSYQDPISGKEVIKSYPEGTLFAFAEDYGCVEGKANKGLKLTAREIGARIRQKELDIEEKFDMQDRINAGAADGRIFDTQYGYEKKQSIHDNLIIGYESVTSKRYPEGKPIYELFSRETVQYSGSRIKSFELMRTYLKASSQWPPEDPGLFIFSTCKNWINTVPMLSRDQDKIEDVDTKSEDHCLSGKTIIYTDKGAGPIEDFVGTNGKILTIGGYYVPYNNCRKIKKDCLWKYDLSDKSTLTCTKDHKTIDESGLFTEIQYTPKMLTLGIINKWKLRLFQILYKNLTQLDITNVESILLKKAKNCIDKYGNTSTTKYQQENTFTTLMGIQVTIKLTILHALMPKTICQCMVKKKIIAKLSKQRKAKQKSGMAAKRVEAGIRNTMKILKINYIENLSKIAFNVIVNLRDFLILNSAQINAKADGEDKIKLTISQKFVPFANKRFNLINTINKDAVLKSVPGSFVEKVNETKLKDADTYCLTVPNLNCFVVNEGIVVSNCYDATRYRLFTKKKIFSDIEVAGI